ncbi:PHP domain-containing protein [Streptomyces sp. NPDC050264]|uniref:PHP domain-containing protein n=1 Tax=Streptomyces sp. NPDC050264 TaxID=3155038 RepID=UPI00341C8DBC
MRPGTAGDPASSGLDPAPGPDPLSADHHTHTDHSDGRDPLARMIAAAELRGLTTLYVTDHVRADTTYLPEYVAAVRAARGRTPLDIVCGVEAKIMDSSGRLDLPADLRGIEHIAIADHRYPLPDGPAHPDEVRAALGAGRLDRRTAVDLLVEATVHAVSDVPEGIGAHLAHLFSVLPKAGLDETDVPQEFIKRIADACLATGTAVELNEKWRCPAPRTAAVLYRAGVRLVAGSDAHRHEDVGAWSYVPQALAAAGAPLGETKEPG